MSLHLAELSDEQLFAIYIDERKQAAFAELYERYATAVTDWVIHKYRFERHQAEEIVQQAFLKVHLEQARYDRQKPFRPWLFEICNREAVNTGEMLSAQKRGGGAKPVPLNTHRADSHNLDIDPPHDAGNLVAHFREADGNVERHRHTHEQLYQAVLSLPERDREIITLKFYDKVREREVAERVGMSRFKLRAYLPTLLVELRSRLAEIV